MTYLSVVALITIFVPLFTGPSVYLLSRNPRFSTVSNWISLLAALIVFLTLLVLLPSILVAPAQLDLFTLSLLTIELRVGLYIDLLSLSFALLGSLFGVLMISYGIGYFTNTGDPIEKSISDRSLAFALVLLSGLIGTLFAQDLLMLLVFWEIMSLSLYVLILHERSSDAAFKAFLMTHGGGLGLLAATVILSTTLGTFQIHEIAMNPGLLAVLLPILIPLTLIAVFPKGIQFPFHTWFSDATAAPSSTMVLFLAADLAGIYLLLRLIFQAFEPAFALLPVIPLVQVFGNINVAGFIISIVGSITLIIGGINAIVEPDLPRTIAYSAASELGFVFIVLGLGFPLGITASLFYAISHTLVVGLFFLCAGAVIVRTGKRRINDLGGLYHSMPITASLAAISVLAIGGLPLLSEFIAKYLVVISTLVIGSPFFLFIAIFGELIHIVIATRILYSVFLSRSKATVELNISDPPAFMLAPMLLIAALIVIIGVYPMLLLDGLVLPSVAQLGMPLDDVIHFLVLPAFGGIWSPTIIVASTLLLFSIFIIAVMFSVRRGRYVHEPNEEAFKPFVCGEDIREYELLHSDLFHTLRSDILRLERFIEKTDIDRAYGALSRSVYVACSRMLKLDVKYYFSRAFLWFVSGIIVLLLVTLLVV